MKVKELNQIFKTIKDKVFAIADICDEDRYVKDYYNDLNHIHEPEIQFLNILTEEQHWLQITESMGFNKGINIGHWPAEASDRADAFLLTMFRIKNQSLEFVKTKSKEYQFLYERLQYILP